ncbi:hypothetical protein 000TH008_241 [Bacillus phage 000TH008]|nr:hypothetical protein 000TH008_241 [Bacillus phage 000TH008]
MNLNLVKELEEAVEELKESLRQSKEQNKIYEEALQEIIGVHQIPHEVLEVAREALQGGHNGASRCC